VGLRLGQAIARRYAEEGAEVIVNDIRAEAPSALPAK